MSAVELPMPVVRPLRPTDPVPGIDVTTLERELVARVDGEVRFDTGSRGAYSTDASNYRQIPIRVVVPRSVAGACRTRNINSPAASRATAINRNEAPGPLVAPSSQPTA